MAKCNQLTAVPFKGLSRVLLVGQRDEDDEEDDGEEEVRSELSQLTDKLKQNETTSDSVASQLRLTDAAIRDDTKRVCALIIPAHFLHY